MNHKKPPLHEWIVQSGRRKRILEVLRQPMTVNQLAKKTTMAPDTCSEVLGQLSVRGVVTCLNRDSQRNRLYWLTGAGDVCRQEMRAALALPALKQAFPTVDWHLYGEVCFRHRSAVIRTLQHPMQPAAIKRKLRLTDPDLRISANNVRDVMSYLKNQGIVRAVQARRNAHPRYELTAVGRDLLDLLKQAGAIGGNLQA